MRSVDPLTTLPTAKVADLQKAGQPQTAILPKPKGSLYNLQRKMGLDDDPAKYDETKVRCYLPVRNCRYSSQTQATWKKLIRIAAFEDGVTFANQPKEKIVKFAKRVRGFQLSNRASADRPT